MSKGLVSKSLNKVVIFLTFLSPPCKAVFTKGQTVSDAFSVSHPGQESKWGHWDGILVLNTLDHPDSQEDVSCLLLAIWKVQEVFIKITKMS